MTYVLERNEEEYERLHRQSSMWEPATARLLDRIALAPAPPASTPAAVRATPCG
jgi:hypothetical protein